MNPFKSAAKVYIDAARNIREHIIPNFIDEHGSITNHEYWPMEMIARTLEAEAKGIMRANAESEHQKKATIEEEKRLNEKGMKNESIWNEFAKNLDEFKRRLDTDPSPDFCKYHKVCELYKACHTCHDNSEASEYCGKYRELDRKR